MRNLILILLIFTGLAAKSQGTFSISGIARDEKGQTIPGATVFISNSKTITQTNVSGEFRIGALQPGTYEIAVKMLGFQNYTQDVLIQQKSVELQIVLKETSIALDAVTIRGRPDPNRGKYLEQFTKYFLGESLNALRCKILNPEVLNLRYDKVNDILEASAVEFLVIENERLGYKINYSLSNFKMDFKKNVLLYEGSSYFEELEGTTGQEERWERNREIAYEGSVMHFFRAAYNNTAEAEGFLVYDLPDKRVLDMLSARDLSEIKPLSIDSLFPSLDKDFKAFGSNSATGSLIKRDFTGRSANSGLYVIYTREEEPVAFINSSGERIQFPMKLPSQNRQISMLYPLKDRILVDKKGSVPAGSFLIKGYWTWEMIGDLLPKDYESKAAAPALVTVPDASEPFTSALNTFRNKVPLEKVHLHLDKPYYTIGDTIWLKAYVVNAEKNQTSEISKVVYVDLVNDRDSVKAILRLFLDAGKAAGDIILADTLREGNYRIRAYTNWMRNFGQEFFFDKAVSIGNSLSHNMVASTVYTITKNGSMEEVSAEISYRDLSGKAIKDKEVNYEIALSSGRMIGGNNATDSAGIVRFKFNVPSLESGRINTTVKLDGKTFVKKEIPFNAGSLITKVQFFPEGGQLVSGISSRIAFKALGGDGLSREISGYIADKDNKNVAEFRSEHAGMGSFILKPLPGNSYSAVIRLEDGTEQKSSFPVITPQGYVLSVNKIEEDLQVKIDLSKELTGRELTLVCQMNGIVNYLAKKKAESTSLSVIIPQTRFQEGILQLTLFDTRQPVAERLIFIKNETRHLKIEMSADKLTYRPREKASINMQVTDAQGNPVQGNFSLAITDEGKVPYSEEKETTIFSSLLLSSDLKGYIEHPNYYFTNPDTNKIRQLDNLMLTQGWRKFAWKEVLAGTFPALTYKAEQGITFSGRVITTDGRPLKDRIVSVLFTGENGFILDTISNAAGRFRFDNLMISNTDKFMIQAKDSRVKSDELVKIEIDKPALQEASLKYPISEVNDNNLLTYLKSSRERFNELKQYGMLNGLTLQEVTVTAQKKTLQEEIREMAVENSSNPAGTGSADQILTFNDLKDCNDIGRCLTTRLVGIKVKKINSARGLLGGGLVSMAFSSRANSKLDSSDPMLLVVDGIPSGSDLSIVAVEDIESIEVLKDGARTAIYGFRGNAGILLITTKRGGIDYLKYGKEKDKPGYLAALAAKAVKSYTAQGFNAAREFYSPDYTSPKTNTQMADLRTTVYWNPSIITDANGKARVEFYNADGTGNYRVITEGLTDDGKLGRLVYRYSVK